MLCVCLCFGAPLLIAHSSLWHRLLSTSHRNSAVSCSWGMKMCVWALQRGTVRRLRVHRFHLCFGNNAANAQMCKDVRSFCTLVLNWYWNKIPVLMLYSVNIQGVFIKSMFIFIHPSSLFPKRTYESNSRLKFVVCLKGITCSSFILLLLFYLEYTYLKHFMHCLLHFYFFAV